MWIAGQVPCETLGETGTRPIADRSLLVGRCTVGQKKYGMAWLAARVGVWGARLRLQPARAGELPVDSGGVRDVVSAVVGAGSATGPGMVEAYDPTGKVVERLVLPPYR